jgi:hypothetical protein
MFNDLGRLLRVARDLPTLTLDLRRKIKAAELT